MSCVPQRNGRPVSALSGQSASSGAVSHLLSVNDMSTGRQFSVPASATTTVAQIKSDVAALTDWPLSQQSWTGWPEHATGAGSYSVAVDRATFSVEMNANGCYHIARRGLGGWDIGGADLFTTVISNGRKMTY